MSSESTAALTGRVAFARITARELDLAEHLNAVTGPESGAVVTFTGQIRNHDPDATGTVECVEYSAHPDAAKILERIAMKVSLAGVNIAVSHRVGTVGVGEIALLACVASAHRAIAYETNRQLIEHIKHELPIWKRQIDTDGHHNWQGLR